MGKKPRTIQEKILLDCSELQFQQLYYSID